MVLRFDGLELSRSETLAQVGVDLRGTDLSSLRKGISMSDERMHLWYIVNGRVDEFGRHVTTTSETIASDSAGGRPTDHLDNHERGLIDDDI